MLESRKRCAPFGWCSRCQACCLWARWSSSNSICWTANSLRLLTASQESFDNLKRVQAQLVQSEKLASLGQLVGGAAHELNNPLTAMMGYSDLLSSTELNGDQRVLMQKIEQQVRRTRTLVSSLLSFAKQVPAEKTLWTSMRWYRPR